MIRSASKPAWRRPPHSRRKGRGGTVLGIFIGLIVGLGLAATVAFYLGRTSFGTPIPSMIAKEAPRSSKADSPTANATPDKPRFDFYKILPGGEEPKVGAMKSDRPGERGNDATRLETAPKTAVAPLPSSPATPAAPTPAAAPAPAKSGDRFWLQAGAFSNESDAENLKARLALSGWEALIQAATLPDKAIRYRVRLGPYDNTDELGRMKTELGQRGFDVAVIKNQ